MTQTQTEETPQAGASKPFVPDEKQQQAIAACCDRAVQIVAVTGKAGTGKTTIMRLAYEGLSAQGLRVVMCAPTGKAAKRITQATGVPAMTIHRLLEYPHPGERDPKTGKALDPTFPKRNRMTPLDVDAVLCDEYAMVGNDVHRNLVDALPRGGLLRAFGDINQLPPVEPTQYKKKNKDTPPEPSPFATLLDKFTGITLDLIHRQGEGSGIVKAGASILNGRVPVRTQDFTMRITDKPLDALTDYVKQRESEGVLFNTVENQIICVQSTSWVGTHRLNALLQLHFRKESDGWIKLPRHTWDEQNPVRIREGDKVIFTQNYYATEQSPDYEVFNGETGIVTKVYGDTEEFEVDLGDRHLCVPPNFYTKDRNGEEIILDPRRDIQLAYALTTHKCQGSEYKHVAYVLNKSALWVQNRNNFYTAVTRARESAHLICDSRSLDYSLWKRGDQNARRA